MTPIHDGIVASDEHGLVVLLPTPTRLDPIAGFGQFVFPPITHGEITIADRVTAQITIGGTIAASTVPALIEAIQAEGLSTEDDGPPFEPDELVSGEALTLRAHEVAWGVFRDMELFCRTHRLAYSRWFGACSGAWGTGRSIYRGVEGTREEEEGVDDYDASDDDQTLLGEQLARHLGSYDAIVAHFERANFTVPPLEIVGATSCARTAAIAVSA